MPSFVLASSQHPPPFSHAAMPSSNIFSSIANKISGKGKSSSNQKTNSWASSTSSATRSTRLSRGSTRTVDSSHNGASASQDQPPAYQEAISSPRGSGEDDRYAFLKKFDTVLLVDDSTSMLGENWLQTRDALAAIAPICTKYDSDGIDLYFLNAPDSEWYHNIQRSDTIFEIFSSVTPRGATPTGQKLHQILKQYLAEFAKHGENVKPLNIIVITDGEATDDVESSLISAAKKLDRLDAPAWQCGVQFFQVGHSTTARQHLKYLDDNLCDRNGRDIRDMVDTVPWTGESGTVLNAEGILKVVLGAVNRRLDRSGVSLHLSGH